MLENWNSMSTEEKDKAAEMYNFFCGLHLFIAFAECVDKTLNDYEFKMNKVVGAATVPDLKMICATSSLHLGSNDFCLIIDVVNIRFVTNKIHILIIGCLSQGSLTSSPSLDELARDPTHSIIVHSSVIGVFCFFNSIAEHLLHV